MEPSKEEGVAVTPSEEALDDNEELADDQLDSEQEEANDGEDDEAAA